MPDIRYTFHFPDLSFDPRHFQMIAPKTERSGGCCETVSPGNPRCVGRLTHMADATDAVSLLTPCHTPPAGRRSQRDAGAGVPEVGPASHLPALPPIAAPAAQRRLRPLR